MISISNGLLECACLAIEECINKGFPGGDRALIGIITFDSRVHFYDLDSSMTQPKLLMIPDLEDVFLPFIDSLLVNINENKKVRIKKYLANY